MNQEAKNRHTFKLARLNASLATQMFLQALLASQLGYASRYSKSPRAIAYQSIAIVRYDTY